MGCSVNSMAYAEASAEEDVNVLTASNMRAGEVSDAAVGGDEEPRDSGGERRVSEAAPGADRDVGPCAPTIAGGANGSGIKKLFGEEKRQISGTSKRHARKSRKRVNHQKDADFDPRQQQRYSAFGNQTKYA